MANPANSTAYRLVNGPFAGRMAVDVTEAKTLAIADSGYVQMVKYDNAVITLPATAVAAKFTIVAAGVQKTSAPVGTGDNASMKLSVSPVAADRIQGGVDGTATDDKDLILAKATMRVNDFVEILSLAETNGPLVGALSGIWTREA